MSRDRKSPENGAGVNGGAVLPNGGGAVFLCELAFLEVGVEGLRLEGQEEADDGSEVEDREGVFTHRRSVWLNDANGEEFALFLSEGSADFVLEGAYGLLALCFFFLFFELTVNHPLGFIEAMGVPVGHGQ